MRQRSRSPSFVHALACRSLVSLEHITRLITQCSSSSSAGTMMMMMMMHREQGRWFSYSLSQRRQQLQQRSTVDNDNRRQNTTYNNKIAYVCQCIVNTAACPSVTAQWRGKLNVSCVSLHYGTLRYVAATSAQLCVITSCLCLCNCANNTLLCI